MTLLLFLLGLGLLVVGANCLVAGASNLASRAGISPLVIGLTVVAFGTSAPELGVSLQAVWTGKGTIALGNVVGSNIFNVLFILGAAAAIAPLVVSAQLIRFDVPLMIGGSLLAYAMAWDGAYTSLDGLVLVGGLVAYTTWLFFVGKGSDKRNASTPVAGNQTWWRSAVYVAVGLGLLGAGANLLVDAAVEFAAWFGIGQDVVGLTIVAAGTSLPEAVTSIVASLRGERDIAVGNVVGSNVFNLLGVLGLSALLAPRPIAVPAGMVHFDLPVLCAAAAVTLPMFFTGGKLARWEGLLLLGYFAAYTSYIVMVATRYPGQQQLADAMFYFAAPLTVLTLGVTTWQSLSAKTER